MRRRRLLIVLLVALAAGLAAAYLSLNYLRQQATPLIASTPKAQIVVAAKPMVIGHIITSDDVKLVDWPGGDVPQGYFTSTEQVIGHGVITPLVLNEPVLAAKVAAKDSGGGLPIVIPEGMRAVSVRVDEVITVAGFVLPQERVDVIVTIPQGGKNKLTQFVQRLENVEVLTAGQITQRSPDGTPHQVSVMTFLVTPDQAELLIAAQKEGQIQLALRNTLDTTSIVTQGTRSDAILSPASGGPGRRSAVATRAAARPAAESQGLSGVIEVYKGGKRTLIRH